MKINTHEIDAYATSKLNDEDVEYVCDMLDEHGELCGATFSNKQALIMHQRGSNKHKANHVTLADLVVGNACIFCETALASRHSAIQHVRNSIITGRCKTDMSYGRHELQAPSDIQCMICSEEHIREISQGLRDVFSSQ